MWNKWYKVQIVSIENKNYQTVRLMENIPLAVVKNSQKSSFQKDSLH